MAVTVDKKTVDGIKETIRNLYLADDIPWVIGYSGGKDSTATLELIWLSLAELPHEQKKKQVHIINTDTLVESPIVSRWVKKSLETMTDSAREQQLPFVTHILNPEVNNTFWVNLLGRGYPFPRKKYRWCTDRLKIQPVNKFIKDKIAEHGEIILVLGTRKAESSRRARTMNYYEKHRVRELLSPNPTLANEYVFSPLENWTDDDVWVFLMQNKNPWGYSNMDLLTLYRGATADNECPLMTEKNLPSCGRSRFGCWVCTMVERDKSMEAMIFNDEEKVWMTPLLDFRNEFGDEEHDRERRSFRRMNGAVQGNYNKLFHGPYKKEWREKWLEKLLTIQKNIQDNGPEDFRSLELITMPELRKIRRIWVHDKHEFDDSLPVIYKRVYGKEFDDPEWINSSSFGEEEWNELKDVCHELYGDEELLPEMIASLIDTEENAFGNSNRKGLIDKLDQDVRKCFYKNEDDALVYYKNKEDVRKAAGADYNEKFYQLYIAQRYPEYNAGNDEDEDVDA